MTDRFLTYVVTVDTPAGRLDVEVPTHLGIDAAKRRAVATLFMQQGTGTPDDYVTFSIQEGRFDD